MPRMCACSVAQCPTLCDTMDCSPPGFSVHGISQAIILEWVAISFSRGSSWPRNWIQVSCISCIGRWILYNRDTWEAPFSSVQSFSSVQVFATPWTAACQASLSITISQSLLKLVSFESWCHPTISSSVIYTMEIGKHKSGLDLMFCPLPSLLDLRKWWRK